MVKPGGMEERSLRAMIESQRNTHMGGSESLNLRIDQIGFGPSCVCLLVSACTLCLRVRRHLSTGSACMCMRLPTCVIMFAHLITRVHNLP